MLRMSALAVLLLTGVSQAAGCTISNARYENDELAWWLSFKPVPRISAPNQTLAFIIELANSGVTLEGAVHHPNGFGSPLWSISGPCKVDDTQTCTFVEGDHTAMYGNYGGSVAWIDDQRGAKAPDQVILPRLAASLWYSMYRQDEFTTDDGSASDVFTLTGCD